MGDLKQYTINFKELELGEYNFGFEIDNTFFEHFEKTEIHEGVLNLNVHLLKEERLITLDISMDGTVKVRCDRCLDYFDFPLEFHGKLYLDLSNASEEDREDIINIAEDQSDINLAQYFYESIHLSLPLKRVHPEDEEGNSTCNQNMLDLIEQYKQGKGDDSIDPRWEKLRKLFVERN